MLTLKQLDKTFGAGTASAHHALCGIDLTLQDGEFVTVIGSNGAGKSTLFGAVSGSFFVDRGRIALDGEDIASRSTYRPVQVYAADINSDGVIELPRAVLMAGYKDAAAHDALYMLDWYAYGLGTTPVQVSTTYQCISDAWSLRIDRSWHDRITAVKSTDGGLSMVSFYEYRGAGQSSIPLFNIYCVTGSSREYYAGRTDLIQLGQTSQAVYFAKIPEGAQSGTLKIGVARSFRPFVRKLQHKTRQ